MCSMGKRGPKQGQGGRPRGGKHSDKQRSEWRLRKIESERNKAEHEAVLERIRIFPEFQQLSKAKQKRVEKIVIHNLVAIDKILDEKMKEVEIYAKKKLDEIYDRKLKAVLALALETDYKAEQLMELLNKNE